MRSHLQVMKFGGTSVGDASCIARAAKIIVEGHKAGPCVAVVSAMSGVTNKLIEAARLAESGNAAGALEILDKLQAQHETALVALILDVPKQSELRGALGKIFAEGRRLLEGTALLRELTPRTLDAISSLGERLSAPLVSA